MVDGLDALEGAGRPAGLDGFAAVAFAGALDGARDGVRAAGLGLPVGFRVGLLLAFVLGLFFDGVLFVLCTMIILLYIRGY